MKLTRFTLLVLGVLLPSTLLLAEEGMWMPQQIPELAAKLKAMGFKGDPKAFADLTGQPMGAVVSLGGCTASFVSPDALIVTNHHCATGGLQFNSTPTRNLLKDGYLAKTRDAELPTGPGSRVFVTTSVVDVTSAITGNIDPKIADLERYQLIDRRVKERVAACEKSGQRCNVASFFDGLKYFEIAQMEIKDVRLVYSPAEGIGVFGGETDNWRWPRPHRRLELPPRLRRQGRQTRPVLQGQRALQTEALAQGFAGRHQARRPGVRHRLSRSYTAPSDLCRSEGNHRVAHAPHHSPL